MFIGKYFKKDSVSIIEEDNIRKIIYPIGMVRKFINLK